MPPQKRGREVIDLTGDYDDPSERAPKAIRGSYSQPAKSSQRQQFGSSQEWSAPQSSASLHSSQGGSRVYGNGLLSSRGSFNSSAYPSTSPNGSFSDRYDTEVLDLTQEDDGPPRELYGSLDNKIVGVRYYNGYASPGEIVIAHREPTNQYDSNAIRVTNVMGAQIGHLPRTLVERLAPYMDRDEIAIEAVLTGEKGMFECPIRINLYGTSSSSGRLALEDKLKKDKLLKATQLKQTRAEAESQRKAMGLKSGRSSTGLGAKVPPQLAQVTMKELLKSSQAVQFRSGEDIAKNLAIDENQLEKMPKAKQPAALKSQLLPYQLQGLAWMLSKEKPKCPAKGSAEVVQLWKSYKNGFFNIATNFFVQQQPKLLSGGILADDMGLGKTLQIISLALEGGPGPTLVVAPVSVMSNWEQQINKHVLKEYRPKVLIYHSGKKLSPVEVAKYDVVVTSYGKLASENERGNRCLLSVKWTRVVLDEGHTIRNPKTKAALAACQLEAQSRWVLTGTPIINNIKDLQSLLRFLRITGGIEEPSIFNSLIGRPLSLGHVKAEALLQTLMQDLCLRRKKDMKFVDLKLPPKSEYVHRITFRPEEKAKYDALLSEARGVLEEYRNKSKVGSGQFQNVLERLLRLRQTCNHWTLCKQRIDDLMKLLEDQEVVVLNDKNKGLLQQALQLFIESQEDCPVCIDSLSNPVITHCKHVFCQDCITKVIEVQHKCPMCRNQLTLDSLLEPAPEVGEEDESFDVDTQSSKTEALLKILQATCKDPKSKVVVFSQWTSFLNIIQHQLVEAGYKFTRIDGSMNTDKRDRALDALDNDPDTRIMLASLSVCSVGLNLVSADTVILSDSWWAPAIEDQAVDRVHRLGQTRPTTIWRLVMENTVEERVLDIQSEKRLLVNKAFQEKTKGKKTKETRMADILKLLG